MSEQHPQIPVEASGDRLKIRCHSCGARYLVPAARVQGRRFRVVCKHCSGIIVARCDKGSFTVMPAGRAGIASSPEALRLDSSELDEEDAPTLAVAPVSGGWYMGISGQPHGPFGDAEVESYLARGKVGGRTWAWRVGETNWRRLCEIPEFSDLLLNDQLTHVYRQDDESSTPSSDESAPTFNAIIPPGVSSDSDTAATALAALPGSAPPPEALASTDLAQLEDAKPAPPRSPTLDLSQSQHRHHQPEEASQDAAAEAATASLPHVERWRRRTELGMAGAAPGKLSEASWEEVSESGVHDKRPESTGSRMVGAPKGDMQAWSARPHLKKTLPLAGASPVFDSQMPPLADALGEERPSDEEALSAARLPTELLQLIPAKMIVRSRQTMAPAQISFAPPLPDRALNMATAGPSLVLRPKPRFWTTGRVLAAALVGTAALIAMAVPLVAHFARPSRGVKDVVEEMTPQPRPRQPGVLPVTQRAASPKAAAKTRNPVKPSSAPKTPDAQASTALRSKPEPPKKDETSPAAPPKRAKRPSPKRTRRKTARAKQRKQRAAAATKPKPPTKQLTADESNVVTVGEEPADEAPGTDTAEAGASSLDADAILAAGAVRRRSNDNLPKTLSKKRIKRVMGKFRSSVQACFDKHQDAGILKLKVTVQPYGRAVARAVGPLANTATAGCALKALPRLRFPRFGGEPVTFTYPYALQ